MRFYWLCAALVLSTLLTILNVYALENYWYWFYPWSDIPMHILGGAAIGSFVIALFPHKKSLAYLLILSVSFVGWEVFEFINGITYFQPNYWFDTFHDLLDDAIGGVLIYILARYTLWRSQ